MHHGYAGLLPSPLRQSGRFTATYCQREANQPSNFNYCNLGAQWNFNWQSYITDDPNNPSATVTQAVGGGGSYTYTYSASGNGTDTFAPQFDTYQQLSRPTGGLPYTLVNPDGSQLVYGQSDGSTSAPRNVFLTQMVDPAGNATTLTYDNELRITVITDPLGRQMTFTYGNASDPYKITQVTDPFGRSATFTYDASDRLIQIQDMIGILSKFTYDGTGTFINSLTTPYGTTTFTTAENGVFRLLTATDPAGDTEVLETNGAMVVDAGVPGDYPIAGVDAAAPVGLTSAPLYNTNLYYRNSFLWSKKQWKEFPHDHTKAYLYHWLHDTDGTTMSRDLESEKPPLESRIWYAYPGQTAYIVVGTQSTPSGIGRLIEGGSQISHDTVNAVGKYLSVVDPLGRQTNFTYAANGIDLLSAAQMVNGAPATLQSMTYNGQHEPLTYTDAAGQTTKYTYNAQGQVTSLTDPLGNTTTLNYYSADASGHQRNGRVSQIIGALPGNTDVWAFDYDAIGRVSSVTGPDGYNLAYAYDNLDRITTVTYPDGTTNQVTYSALDPQTSVDRLGRTTSYTYNSLRQLIGVTDPLNRTTQFAWCRCGALSQLIDAMGRITTWRRDVEGRATSKIFADGSASSLAYEPLSGRLSTTTDEKGQVKTNSYNMDDTVASIAYSNSQVATAGVSFTYDPNFQRVTGMVDGTGATSYSYYPIASGTLGAGRLAGETGPLPNATLSYSYDALGRRIGWAVNGTGENHVLNSIGQMTSVTNALGTFGYTYVGATPRLATVTDPNGLTCNYDYQPLTGDFCLKDITHTQGGNTVSQHSYVFDAAGRITRWTQNFPQGGIARSWLCGYDNADQLTSVASQDPNTLANLPTGQYGYTYDAAGNRTSFTLDGGTTTANYNALNQQGTQASGTTPSLPAQTYQWDAENRLVAINYTGTNQQTQFQYDGLGRRVRITELQGGSTTSDTRFVWRGNILAEARDTTGGNVQTRYFGQGVQSVAGTAPGSYYYLRDHLGSIRALTDSTGAIRAGYDYDPYGTNTKLLGDLDTDERFTGFYNHAPSGLALAVFRSYDHNLGRWINRDPLEEKGGLNLYAYVNNAPTAGTDPLGFGVGARYEWIEKHVFDPCTDKFELVREQVRVVYSIPPLDTPFRFTDPDEQTYGSVTESARVAGYWLDAFSEF